MPVSRAWLWAQCAVCGAWWWHWQFQKPRAAAARGFMVPLSVLCEHCAVDRTGLAFERGHAGGGAMRDAGAQLRLAAGRDPNSQKPKTLAAGCRPRPRVARGSCKICKCEVLGVLSTHPKCVVFVEYSAINGAHGGGSRGRPPGLRARGRRVGRLCSGPVKFKLR
jgi:hypothetical protein